MTDEADSEDTRTRDELLAVAAELDIDGRSKMKRDELAEAVAEAEASEAVADPAPEPAPAAPSGEPRFARKRIIADAANLTGHPAHVLVGALHDVEGDGPVTIREATAAADAYLNRPVRED